MLTLSAGRTPGSPITGDFRFRFRLPARLLPFAILPCEEDGTCGYHSIVRHCLPYWNASLDEYNEQVLFLKQATKLYNLHNFTPELEVYLQTDYPHLSENGLSVKDNYDQHFGTI